MGPGFIHVVAVQVKPEDEDRLNKWYNEVHIPMLLKYKKLKGVTRYKQAYDVAEYPRYISICQFDSREDFEGYQASPELAAAVAEMQESWPGDRLKRVWRVQYGVLKSFKQ